MLSLPVRALGVFSGIVVGTAVSAVRKPIDEDKFAVNDLRGENRQGRVTIPAAVLWAPFAAVTGILEAPFFALHNSLVNYHKPFSKEQFSLGEKD
jgi:hypothetical protein